MKLKEFLSTNNIKLNQNVLKLCLQGIKYMKNTKDLHHSERHIERILDNLDYILKKESIDNLNFSILLTSICWHDVWKSTRKQTTNFFLSWLEQCYEGYGSSRIFDKQVKKFKVSGKFIKRVDYVIKRHVRLEYFFPLFIRKKIFEPKTLEAILFRDLDALDTWNVDRLIDLENEYIKKKKFKKLHIPILWGWYVFVLKRVSDERFYFETSKKLFLKRRKELFNKIDLFKINVRNLVQ